MVVVLVPTAPVIAISNRALLAAAVPVPVCQPRVVDGVIPSWAQAGFHPPDQRMPYEIGAQGPHRCAALGLSSARSTTDNAQQQDPVGVRSLDQRCAPDYQCPADDRL